MLPAEQGSMLDYALGYLADEWSVLPVCTPIAGRKDRCEQHGPCRSAGKLPLVKWGIYQDRLPTRHEVELWWRRNPTANISLVTGEVSDVVVIDLDGELAVREAERLGLEDGPWVRTGRPGGQHRYFRYRQDAPTIFARAGGIDFRGQGGYALLPPSLHWSGARYGWGRSPDRGEPLPTLPSWINDLAGSSVSSNGHVDLEFSRLLEGIPEGERDFTLFREAAKLRGAGVTYEVAVGVIEVLAARCQPPFDSDEARAKVDSAYSRYQPNAPESPRLLVPGKRVVDPVTGEVVTESAWQSLADLVSITPERTREIVHGLIWGGRTHWVYSAPTVGKTLFICAALMHVAAGREFCGRPVEQGPVLLIEEDSPLGVLGEYIGMLAEIYDFDLASLPFWVNRSQGFRITDANTAAEVARIVDSAPQQPSALMIDACERIVPSERFSSKELEPLARLLQIYSARGIANIVIDHTRKSQIQQSQDPLDLLYGGRTKSAISDVMLYFTGSIKSSARANFIKFRGLTPPPIDVHFDPATGFLIKSRARDLTETERQIMRTINDVPGSSVTKAELQDATGLAERTIDRACARLIEDDFLVRDDLDRIARFRVAPGAPGIFG